MKAMLVKENEALVWSEVADPVIGEDEVLVLRVYVYKVCAQLLECCELYGHIANKGTTLTCCSNYATHNNLILIVEVVILEECLEVMTFDVERSLHDTVALEVLGCLTLVLSTEQQAQRAEKNRLSSTCLTSDDVQVLVPLDV